MKNIDDVRNFWNQNPLYTGEFSSQTGSKEWFDSLYHVKLKDCFCGNLTAWVPEDIDGKEVLDVGCGPGFWLRPFHEAGANYRAIDISSVSAGLAKQHRDLYGIEADIQVGNAEQIPFPDNSFDYVISEGVIHHTPDTQQCIREIYRVLKPGGRAAVGLYYKSFLLRNLVPFKICLKLVRILGIGLIGRGRDPESLSHAMTPEELVRMYDGDKNPIGKAYSVPELREMFSGFTRIKFSRYFFPARALPFWIPDFLHRWLQAVCGLMILVQAEK